MTGFFVAGMKTIQISTMNTIYYTTRHAEYGAKLLEEVYPVLEKASNNIVEDLDYDSVQEFEYLQQCYNESLRIEPPANITVPSTVTKELTIGKGDKALTLKPGMLITQMTDAVHHDPTQWIEHDKYNPARFDFKDKDNKWTLTPDG
jgi:cytochrome P450 family 6